MSARDYEAEYWAEQQQAYEAALEADYQAWCQAQMEELERLHWNRIAAQEAMVLNVRQGIEP